MKKNKGISLVELILVVCINSIIMVLIATTFNLWIKEYKCRKSYNVQLTSAYEAIMYIDYYINYKSKGCRVEDNKIICNVDKKIGEEVIYLDKDELKVFYLNEIQKDEGSTSYTSQPLLYGVKNFEAKKLNKVLYIKIVTEGGIEVEKTIGKV